MTTRKYNVLMNKNYCELHTNLLIKCILSIYNIKYNDDIIEKKYEIIIIIKMV